MENRDVLSQLDFSANAGCRRGLLRRLCSPCIGLRGRAMLSPYHGSSGHKRHCPQWRRLSQPRGSPKRCSQSLQPDELGRRRLGDVVPGMVCSRRSPKNCWLDGPIDQVKRSRKRWCASGFLFNANIEAEGYGGLDALVLVEASFIAIGIIVGTHSDSVEGLRALREEKGTASMRRQTSTGIYFDRPQIHIIPMQQAAQCRALGNDRGAEWFIRWPRRELPYALASTWMAGFAISTNNQSGGGGGCLGFGLNARCVSR